VSETTPQNSLGWRVGVLEREVERLKSGQPDVVAERVGMLSLRVTELKAEVNEDMSALREQIKSGDELQAKQIRDFRRIFVGVFSALGVTVAASVIALIITGGAT
jgi:uncharacterized small protein (DUF1192 family)